MEWIFYTFIDEETSIRTLHIYTFEMTNPVFFLFFVFKGENVEKYLRNVIQQHKLYNTHYRLHRWICSFFILFYSVS